MRRAHVQKTHAAQDRDYDKVNAPLTMRTIMTDQSWLLVGPGLSST